MKRSLVVGLGSLILLNATLLYHAAYTDANTCTEGEALVCYDNTLRAYYIEENAQVSVQVETPEYGEALVALWNLNHPERTDVLSYSVVSEEQESDLRFITQTQAAYEFDQLSTLDMSALKYELDLISPELNQTGIHFLPTSAEGFAFITNQTKLETLGVDLSDSNQDNLIDAIDTFDKIQALQSTATNDQNSFVFSLIEPYSFYPFLTASGWQLFDSHDALDPGFEDATFLESLTFIQSLSYVDWNGLQDNVASNYDFAYSEALKSDDFIFSMVSTWMFAEDYQAQTSSTWRVSSFPSLHQEGSALSPFLREVKGYVLSTSSLYPSASHEVLRLIQSTEGLQAFVDNTQLIPLSSKTQLNQLSLDQGLRKYFALAFTTARSEPLIAFENNVALSAFNLYFEIELMPKIQALWNGELSVEETRNQIAMASDAWLYQHQSIESEVQINESK